MQLKVWCFFVKHCINPFHLFVLTVCNIYAIYMFSWCCAVFVKFIFSHSVVEVNERFLYDVRFPSVLQTVWWPLDVLSHFNLATGTLHPWHLLHFHSFSYIAMIMLILCGMLCITCVLHQINAYIWKGHTIISPTLRLWEEKHKSSFWSKYGKTENYFSKLLLWMS